ncbi:MULTISPECIES: Asp-tRNA(Asn)/Glu-tRNA(Gln) amidotransferase subunit GatA [Legionella]|uniref:Glutamyl-tRNA(Gln) amidotransferase subunit A n=1 Tax=Legionella septentrionalis TaxID=2498109 RepID=A0A433JKY3_9GAMM|nr:MULTISPECIES: Asp-tRNA(Asn)/Glu-tRNA(Gln) amidotransferase subunit GatA [Legionella]MCP0913471.1 Asp-tRNA(Asn)/Glu-tRNA(Gln) amidotransferase subunit GatA [Legionella sp. 27cVA30]RUQ89752.1 Asp-tRNA(Asn)/Glu-tRNA(Gln) amidotransferase subunit GatA [Legionella septentrionalis]RUQ99541.1 Asp-tRNA(Asn)/Glu-tRNA(Gln) amidotransferase subunit GatA [Legionella septentrionalis]RUR11103.1 Asp-tRNA(Asn)/Glu-tRNA(Gln) amidotransferase subunit GatA [Legionella septentrionalis]
MPLSSLRALSESLHTRRISSKELTEYYLKRMQKMQELNAFISLDEEHAFKAATAADRLLQQGRAHALTGIPMAHKDIFCTQIMPTTCGSRMLANFHAPYNATVVNRIQAQGAVLLGKTNMDEFAMGSTSETSYFGPVKNPWDKTCVAGGSSGGSAAAVAAGLVPYATGSDTGGSIRQPAAFCGISGLKPTYGLVSRFGMVAFASSLDQAGPMAYSVSDIALILQVMAGFDEQDSTSVKQAIPNYLNLLDTPLKPLKIGLPACFFQSQVDAEVRQALQTAISLLTEAGHEVIELDLHLQSLWVPCYYVIACAEASSNLSRYDGIRFGHQATQVETLFELITRSRDEGFGLEVKRRILTGTYVLSSGYFDAYYLQAQKVRRMIQDELLQTLEHVDVIIGPTTPTAAFKLGEKISDPTQRYLADVFTVAANLAGLPALSIPVGFSQGLPIGMQIIGPHFSEARLLHLAHNYQQCTTWHRARPTTDEDSL